MYNAEIDDDVWQLSILLAMLFPCPGTYLRAGSADLPHASLERSQLPTKPPSITVLHTAIDSLHVTRKLLRAV